MTAASRSCEVVTDDGDGRLRYWDAATYRYVRTQASPDTPAGSGPDEVVR